MTNEEKIIDLLGKIVEQTGEKRTDIQEGTAGSSIKALYSRTKDTTSRLTREIISKNIYANDFVISRDSTDVVTVVALASAPDVVDRTNRLIPIIDGVSVQMSIAQARSLANQILSCLENEGLDDERQ